MSKRLIITEEEKKQIKILYEEKLDYKESVLIDRKNPFSSTSTQTLNGKTIGQYSNSLKDGDMFYKLNEEDIKNWALNLVNQTLENKKVRVNRYSDEDYVSVIPKFDYIVLNTSFLLAPIHKTKMVFTKVYVGRPDEYYTLTNDGVYTDRNNGDYETNKETSNNILNILKQKLTWDKVPDDFFEIRKVQKQTTDF